MDAKDEAVASSDVHIAESRSHDVGRALRLRDHALSELVETEKTYVDGLGKLIIIYMKPLMEEVRVLSPTEHEQMFPKVLLTISNLHNQMLAELDYTFSIRHDEVDRGSMSIASNVGRVMLKYGPSFKMYQIYMNSFERAQKALTTAKQKNRRFAKWLEVAQEKTAMSAGNLESLLILPIQRIPRYQLLLKEVIKQSRRAGLGLVDDLPDLEEALKMIADITELIESRMEDFDRRRKCQFIERKFVNLKVGDLVTPSRRFIAESKRRNVRLHQQDGYSMDIVLFLFNDCLLYGHYNEDSWGNQLHYDESLYFDVLFECVVEDNYKKKHCLLLYSRTHSIFISFKKRKLRTKWKGLIESANEKANKLVITNLRHQMSDRPAPCYIPDDFSDFCLECNGKFTFTNRKHHCRRCGRLLCRECTSWRMNCRHRETKKNQILRCCKKCKNLQSNHLMFETLRSGLSVDDYPRNRLQRVHSDPPKSPSLQSARKLSESAHSASASMPSLSLLTSCTENVLMSPDRHKKRHKKGGGHHHKSGSKRRKVASTLGLSVGVGPKSGATDRGRSERKFSDKMPLSPHINPPTEPGYDHSAEEDLGKCSSLSLSSEDGGGSKAGIGSASMSNIQIKVLQPQLVEHQQLLGVPPVAPLSRGRRGRSYAVASALDQPGNKPVFVGCVITDEEGTEGTSGTADVEDNGMLSPNSSADIVENIPSSVGSSESKSRRDSPFSINNLFAAKQRRSSTQNSKKKRDKKSVASSRGSSLSSWM